MGASFNGQGPRPGSSEPPLQVCNVVANPKAKLTWQADTTIVGLVPERWGRIRWAAGSDHHGRERVLRHTARTARNPDSYRGPACQACPAI